MVTLTAPCLSHVFHVLLSLGLLAVSTPGVVLGSCPWEDPELLSWGDPRAWPGGAVPGDGAQVVIEAGRKVLLDRSLDLLTLTVGPGSSLVWGDVEGLMLQTHYLLVDGEFHLGSLTCRFNRQATIRLKGKTGSDYYVIDHGTRNRKVIMVRQGGTLEIHGQQKTSWTKLAQTIPRLADLPCPFVYNHADLQTNAIATDRGSGLHLIVWNEDGTVMDFSVFVNFDNFNTFLTSVPVGKVVGMFAFRQGLDPSLLASGVSRQTDINDVVSALGGRNISSVRLSDSYSLLARKGFPELTQEYFKQGGLTLREPEGYLTLTDWNNRKEFQVASSALTTEGFFRVLNTDLAYPILELAEEVVNWQTGDQVLVTSTDYDWRQAEVVRLVDCPACSPAQIRVRGPFRYRHYGNFTYNVDERAEVGLLSRNVLVEGVMETSCYDNNDPALTLLCKRFGKDTFGGHIKVLANHASVHIEGVELYHMGQLSVLGSYPLHFHMCDLVPGSWFRDNSIHQSFSRCVTIHGSHGAEVSGHVCYDHLGHGYFLEDGVEQNNTLSRNLGAGTQHGNILLSDKMKDWCPEDEPGLTRDACDDLATFWITHPNNVITNNVAAGSDSHGFALEFSELPLTISYYKQLSQTVDFNRTRSRLFPIKRFYANVAHSNVQTGVWMDSKISTGRLPDDEDDVPENGIVNQRNDYEPKDPPGDPSGQTLWTNIERVTAYKNLLGNLWIKGGNINITFASLADSPQGFGGGTSSFQTGTSVEYSIFIGDTDNLGGEPAVYIDPTTRLRKVFARSYPGNPYRSVTGISVYQGPMMVKHSYFDRYYTSYWADEWTTQLGQRPFRYGAAVSFKRDSTYPVMTSQYTANLTFGFCDNVTTPGTQGATETHWLLHGDPGVNDWEDKDGTRAAHNMDRDGSLTGTPGAYVVRPHPFFTGPRCLDRPDWRMSVCPYRYIKMEIIGTDGNLGTSLKTSYPVIIYRDDVPRYPFIMSGQIRREFLLRTHSSYLLDFNATLEGAQFPSVIKVYGYGVERQDVVRLAICVPLDLKKFEVTSDYPVPLDRNNFTLVSSLAQLDGDVDRNAFFHDVTAGIVYFKIWSLHDRSNETQQCPQGRCYNVKLTLLDGTRQPVRSCVHPDRPYPTTPFVDTRPQPTVPETKPCPTLPPSYQGLGAVRWGEVGRVVHEDFNPPCVVANLTQRLLDIRNQILAKGSTASRCFIETEEPFWNPQTTPIMSQQWCVLRCLQRGFRYAGLSEPDLCTCSNVLNTGPAATDPSKLSRKSCSQPCPGDPALTCGNWARLQVLDIAELRMGTLA